MAYKLFLFLYSRDGQKNLIPNRSPDTSRIVLHYSYIGFDMVHLRCLCNHVCAHVNTPVCMCVSLSACQKIEQPCMCHVSAGVSSHLVLLALVLVGVLALALSPQLLQV